MASRDRGVYHGVVNWWWVMRVVPWSRIVTCGVMLKCHNVELVKVNLRDVRVWPDVYSFWSGKGKGDGCVLAEAGGCN